MYKFFAGSSHNLNDTADFLTLLENLPDELQEFFTAGRDVVVTRSPGRLDLMGGIADYSGSLVLQWPIAASTHAALQLRDDDQLNIVSLSDDSTLAHRSINFKLADFGSTTDPIAYETAREKFAADSYVHWAAYVAGAFLVLMRERDINFSQGANILIHSNVPEGKGVSSSAALEVATMQAIAAAHKIPLAPTELAFLCQKAENLIAGAPCGVMDQMTSACGESGQLLALLCQPGQLLEPVKLPDELAVWGIDSGIRHAVSGADYGSVRTAAFMGYRIIAYVAGLKCRETEIAGRVRVDDARWNGYLANLTPTEFAESFAKHLPEQMSGAEFLSRYGGITDAVTTVHPERTYRVLQATRHPIEENARVRRFAAILQNQFEELEANQLGELMYQSHDSYSACGLGSDGTDEIVRLVRDAGPKSGLFGAKITGGGSGGTVAVLGRSDAEAVVHHIADQYAKQTGREAIIISGSSPGTVAFGHLRLKKESEP